jgi:hypothetical protein
MGIKREPCRRNYWSKCHLLHCAVIPKVMSCRRWEAITRCLHLVDNDTVVRDCTQPGYDRIAKWRGIVEVFAHRSRELYNPGEIMTVDELIISYKGRYCRIRQFLRNKPIQFGIKV